MKIYEKIRVTKKNKPLKLLKKKMFCTILNPSEVQLKLTMKLTIFIISAVLLFSFCSVRGGESEFDFANRLAQKGLWKEAHMRWERALATGKNSAALHNNMAVALEQMGKREEAEKEYEKALKLSPNNSRIKGNYERLKNFLKSEDKSEDKSKDKKDNEKKNKKEKE